jgi:hypothetical protein
MEGTVTHALEQFDRTVVRMEVCRGRELENGGVLNRWEKSTCTACDARTFCPSYWKEREPRLPGIIRAKNAKTSSLFNW